MKRVISFLTLFASTGTLICCAIPALLVILGAGAALAGAISTFPQLIWLSAHKLWIFGMGGVLIALSLVSHGYSQAQSCPVDGQKENCETTKKTSNWLLWVSVGLYLVGFTVTFILPKII
ncbi:MAG: hypothetical protein R2877_07380 [Bdellovibrionota bacterium]